MTEQFAEATPQQVVVVPCSGIGKSYGTVTREAAYMVVEDLCPETTHIVPLSLLVLGDEQAQEAVRGVHSNVHIQSRRRRRRVHGR